MDKNVRKQLFYALGVGVILFLITVLVLDYQKNKKPTETGNTGTGDAELTKEQKAFLIAREIADLIGDGDPYNEFSPAYELGQQLTLLGFVYLNSTVISPVDEPYLFMFIPY